MRVSPGSLTSLDCREDNRESGIVKLFVAPDCSSKSRRMLNLQGIRGCGERGRESLAPTGKRRLVTAHTLSGHFAEGVAYLTSINIRSCHRFPLTDFHD
jgi:hypothetical protein